MCLNLQRVPRPGPPRLRRAACIVWHALAPNANSLGRDTHHPVGIFGSNAHVSGVSRSQNTADYKLCHIRTLR